jgi:hypothetical protein
VLGIAQNLRLIAMNILNRPRSAKYPPVLRVLIGFFLFFATGWHLSAQCTLVCEGAVQVSLPQSGSYPVTSSLLAPTANVLCSGQLQLTIWSAPGVTVPNNIITCAQEGLVLQARVKHVASGNFCTSEIEVMDLLPPSISCTDKIVACSQNTLPAHLGWPTFADNCTPASNVSLQYSDNTISLPCGTVHNGQKVLEQIVRTWQASDLSGNNGFCTQKIWLKAPELDSVVFPANRDDIALPTLSCGQSPNDPELVGEPLLYGNPIQNDGPCAMGATHEDQIVAGCSPGAYTVIRTWTVVDFCTSQIKQRVQVIRIADKIKPTLTVPTTYTVSTSPIECKANVTLPLATATDACSAVNVTPTWAFGTGQGPFNGVPEGAHTVTWTATDACGNATTATSLVVVKDDQAPNVACTLGLQVSLGTNGQVYVNASSLNAGSWDNCGPIFLAVSRNDSIFASAVALTCADENQSVPITLRVSDVNGNTNTCQVPVVARDVMKPNLTCPANITLNCTQNPYNLALTGNATATDNCTLVSLQHQNIGTLSGCSTGTLTRRWTATDQAGNTKVCDQAIEVQTISNITVTFPADKLLASCAGPLDVSPQSTGTPIISGISCTPLTATYTDQVLTIVPPASYSILRTWKVVDHCIYNVNNPTVGVWQKVQKIDVIDNVPPVLSVPPSVTVSTDASGCGATVQLVPATATDCSSDVQITHNSPIGSTPNDPSGWYPVGIYNIVFTANDGSGNITQKNTTIEVRDQTIPNAICLSGLALNIGSGGAIVVPPTAISGNCTDNCTPADSLQLAISPAFFTCQHVGQQAVTLTVTDQSGNSAQCQATVLVQDNQSYCGRHSIEGVIYTPLGKPVHGVRVYSGQGDTTYTDSIGRYKFVDLIPNKDYAIRPELLTKWDNGMSSFDFVLISRHILNLEPLSTPEKIIAADANFSNTVTNFDIVQMRKVLIGTLPGVPDSKSWRFYPLNTVFSTPDNPFLTPLPGEILIQGLDSDRTGVDFRGIKIGDIDGNVDHLNPY